MIPSLTIMTIEIMMRITAIIIVIGEQQDYNMIFRVIVSSNDHDSQLPIEMTPID
jgi:hypothetical protein